jgi:hypothetical protein
LDRQTHHDLVPGASIENFRYAVRNAVIDTAELVAVFGRALQPV